MHPAPHRWAGCSAPWLLTKKDNFATTFCSLTSCDVRGDVAGTVVVSQVHVCQWTSRPTTGLRIFSINKMNVNNFIIVIYYYFKTGMYDLQVAPARTQAASTTCRVPISTLDSVHTGSRRTVHRLYSSPAREQFNSFHPTMNSKYPTKIVECRCTQKVPLCQQHNKKESKVSETEECSEEKEQEPCFTSSSKIY